MLTPPVFDLFGEIPVTVDEVRAWVAAVPGLDPDSERGRAYARDWNVVEKIRQAKARGDLEQLLQAGQAQPPHWWKRFRW